MVRRYGSSRGGKPWSRLPQFGSRNYAFYCQCPVALGQAGAPRPSAFGRCSGTTLSLRGRRRAGSPTAGAVILVMVATARGEREKSRALGRFEAGYRLSSFRGVGLVQPQCRAVHMANRLFATVQRHIFGCSNAQRWMVFRRTELSSGGWSEPVLACPTLDRGRKPAAVTLLVRVRARWLQSSGAVGLSHGALGFPGVSPSGGATAEFQPMGFATGCYGSREWRDIDCGRNCRRATGTER